MNLSDLLTFTWPNQIEIHFGDITDQTGYNTAHSIKKDVYKVAESQKYWPNYNIYEIKAIDGCISIFLIPKKPPFHSIKKP